MGPLFVIARQTAHSESITLNTTVSGLHLSALDFMRKISSVCEMEENQRDTIRFLNKKKRIKLKVFAQKVLKSCGINDLPDSHFVPQHPTPSSPGTLDLRKLGGWQCSYFLRCELIKLHRSRPSDLRMAIVEADNLPFEEIECVDSVAVRKKFFATTDHYLIFNLDDKTWRELDLSDAFESNFTVAFPFTESLLPSGKMCLGRQYREEKESMISFLSQQRSIAVSRVVPEIMNIMSLGLKRNPPRARGGVAGGGIRRNGDGFNCT